MRKLISLIIIVALLTIGAFGSKQVQAAKILTISSSIEIDLPIEKVKLAIIRAGAMKGWQMIEIEPGLLEAIVRVRSHVAVVDIHYNDDKYTITYNRSENLGYKNGKIKKNFNKWIQRLDRDITTMFTYM